MTESKGWLKLHRSIITSSVFANSKLLKLWIWILCKAFTVPAKVTIGLQNVDVEKGQFVFGRFAAANELQMTNSTVYRYLKLLEKERMVVVKSNNKFSIVSVVNWCDYQDRKEKEEQQKNNKRTTNEQQMNTNKEYREYKELKNKDNKDNKEFVPPTIEEINSYITEKELSVDGDKFLNYFTESGWVDSKGNKVKNWKLKILTWDGYKQRVVKNGTSQQHSTTTENTSKWGKLDGIIRL